MCVCVGWGGNLESRRETLCRRGGGEGMTSEGEGEGSPPARTGVIVATLMVSVRTRARSAPVTCSQRLISCPQLLMKRGSCVGGRRVHFLAKKKQPSFFDLCVLICFKVRPGQFYTSHLRQSLKLLQMTRRGCAESQTFLVALLPVVSATA